MKLDARKKLALLRSQRAEEPKDPWPTLGLENGAVALSWPMGAIEEQIVEALLRGQVFMAAFQRLGTIDAKAVEDHTQAFIHVQNRLLDTLEFMRLRRLSLAQKQALILACSKALERQRALREAVVEGLPMPPRHALILRNQRYQRTEVDLEGILKERQNLRAFGRRNIHKSVAVGQEMAWRSWRQTQNDSPVDCQWTVEAWLQDLPTPWLKGLFRYHGLEFNPQTLSYTPLANILRSPEHLQSMIADLPIGSHLALETLMDHGGKMLWRDFTHAHGGEDDRAWHWYKTPPTTPLERLRRCGLYMVGTVESRGRWEKYACIPLELRPQLTRIIARLVRNPEARWNPSIC